MSEIKDSTAAGTGAIAILGAIAAASGNRKIRKAVTAAMAAHALHGAAQRWRANRRRFYTLSIHADDLIYGDVQAWILDRMPAEDRRSIVARTARTDTKPGVVDGDGDGDGERSLRSFYDGSRAQSIEIDGHRIRVDVERPTQGVDLGGGSRLELAGKERITFTADTAAGRDAIWTFLAGIAAARAVEPAMWLSRSWGGWTRREAPLRPLETVILRAGQRDRIVDDLARFLAGEADYSRRGRPWHRGYLLHGPPGTGKTSLATALASHFRLDVYYLMLSAVDDDNKLAELFANVPARSVLLLEDVDVVHASRSREDGQPGATLAGLLNALDGFITPHGLVTIMTTNNRAVLDDALVRPGRVDVSEEIGYVDDAQLAALVEWFGARTAPAELVTGEQVTPAEVIDALAGEAVMS